MADSVYSRPTQGTQVSVDAGRLWGGGVATALVAALVAVVGVFICQNVLGVSLTRPALLLDVAGSFEADYALTSFLLAVAATALAHGLALTTPRPQLFFSWIIGAATAAGTAAPFAIRSNPASELATAALNLLLGICLLSLLGAVISRTVFVSVLPPDAPGSTL